MSEKALSPQERLHEALIEFRDRDGCDVSRLYAVIDPVLSDPFPALPGEQRNVIVLPADKFTPQDCPYLLALGEFGRDTNTADTVALALREAVEGVTHGGRSVCAWLAVDNGLPVQQVTRAFARQSQHWVGGARMTFRYWDPRTLDLAIHVLPAQQLRMLLGPASRWGWLSRQGDLMEAKGGPLQTEVMHDNAAQLGEEAARMFARLPQINLVMDSLRAAALDITGVNVADVARRLAEAETQWCLHDPKDQVSYAICCAIYGPSFVANDAIRQQLIAGQTRGAGTLSSVLGLLDTLEPQLPAQQRA